MTEQLLCWNCCSKFIELCGIPHGSHAVQRFDFKSSQACSYCGVPQLLDDLELAQWVPLSEILRYEVTMAVQEQLKKKKMKNRTALEEVQGKLNLDTVLRQVYGPTIDPATKQIVRKECDVLKVVSGRTKQGVELRSINGPLGDLFWPEARYVRLTSGGFLFVDSRDVKLVEYEWHEEAAQAAQ